MGTANFWSHENGIFLVEGYTYEDVKNDMMESEDYTEEEIDDEMVYSRMNDWNDDYYREFMRYTLSNALEEKGYTVVSGKYWAELEVYNKKDKWVAELSLKSGYYDGVQLIVDTDMYSRFADYHDTQASLLEQATPHHKNLLKLIAKLTTPLAVTARFSNGETWYQKAS